MLSPPISNRASNTTKVVKLVFIDLPIVSTMLVFTSEVNSLSGWRITFSRILSKTTIVSFTLYPATVNMPMMKVALTSMPMVFPKMEKRPRMIIVSCTNAMMALMPYR